MNWYMSVLRRYVEFTGRASRTEFWMFVLISVIVSIVLSIIGGFAGDTARSALSSLYSLAVLVPSLALGARRLHDTNRSGWWQLVGLIPVVGWIVLIVFYVMPSDPGDNQYGPPPPSEPPA